MSNPTRKEVEAAKFHAKQGWTIRDLLPVSDLDIYDFILRALDMRDTMERAADTWADRILRGVILKAVKKFDGGEQ